MNHQIHLVGKMCMLVLFNERAGLLFLVSLVGWSLFLFRHKSWKIALSDDDSQEEQNDLCSGWMKGKKKPHLIVSSPLSASPREMHRLRFWVWPCLMLAVFKALLPRGSSSSWYFTTLHSCVGTAHLTQCFTITQLLRFAIGSCSEMTHAHDQAALSLWAHSPYLAVNL